MTIQSEFLPYIDGNDLLAPSPVPTGVMRASDNGPMFSSEYIIILKRNGVMTSGDIVAYQKRIASCLGTDGELHRAPYDTSPDEVDDYYGAYSAHSILGIKPIFKLPIRLWRQPQLLFAALIADGYPSLFLPPLNLIAALVIATSDMFTDPTNTDARRLSWHLIQATKDHSILCKLASLIWYARLHKDYGSDGMKGVAAIYYNPKGLDSNPYSKYWKE